MFGRIQRPEPDVIEVIVGPRATFSGRMQCDASIRIDGAVDSGHIETPANVILTETARVQCDITAKTVSIRGVFQGVIRADRVELLEGCQVYGALHVNSFFMDEGVLLRAELNIHGSPTEDTLELPRPNITSTSIPIVRPSRETQV
ncbi:MAG: polymer-forming cytoskeletal protein [Caldilineaceae bacterium]|nr:polymer-forming cytoskeletal protein [Caldilineaceae bacterium]MCB9148218.1 polymer-forming cytoskeletal protein [Caldilineaceae bacterium]